MSEWTEPIHIEILLPAFCLGMITDEHDDELEDNQIKSITEISKLNEEDEYNDINNNKQKKESASVNTNTTANTLNHINKVHPMNDNEYEDDNSNNEELTLEEHVQFCISAFFMLLVGLSMPSIIKSDSGSDSAHRSMRLLAEAVESGIQSLPNDAIEPYM